MEACDERSEESEEEDKVQLDNDVMK